ncbi:MAG: autotransporter-associated beta strand repeat-containing protein [Verrucomicrobiae bacterium]|nr:autotransporter-associated beta strand repeat-containing protein [Verrucomicrobiae bacterium]
MNRKKFLGIVLLVTMGVVSAQAVNVNYWWSGDGTNPGGTGTWDTTTAHFGTASGGPFPIIWNNTTHASDFANFGGSVGLVTLQPGGINVRRIILHTSGYTLQGGKVTSDAPANTFVIDKPAINAGTINNDFDLTVSGANVNVRIRNQGTVTVPLTLGGNFKFTDATGTKRLDLEGTGSAGSRIDFTGGLLDTPGASVRLRIGQVANNASVYNLSGNSTYAGGTEVVRGTVNISSANAVGSGNVQLATSSTAGGDTVRVFLIGGVNLSNPFSTASASGNAAVTAVLGKDVGDATTSIISGNINLNSDTTSLELRVANANAQMKLTGLVTDGAGTRGFTKTGAGVLELARPTGNTYDGLTVVNAGTLLVNNTSGSATGTGNVQLGAGATLGGDGSVAGTVITMGPTSVLSPGNSVGDLTLGAANFANGATLKFELGASTTPGVTYDQLVINGTLIGSTAAGGLKLEITDAGGLQFGIPYTLITFANASGLDYSDLAPTVLPATLDSSFGTGGFLITDTTLQVQFIPEPGSFVLVICGMLPLLLLGRRGH